VVSGVPIFVPHTRESAGKIIEVTEATLKRIATKANRRENKRLGARSVPGIITIGHRLPALREDDQPAPIGYVVNWRVEPTGEDGLPTLVADLYIHRDQVDVARTFPFRSAEYYPRS